MNNQAKYDVLDFFLNCYSEEETLEMLSGNHMEYLQEMSQADWTIDGVIANKCNKSHQAAFEDAYNFLKNKLSEDAMDDAMADSM